MDDQGDAASGAARSGPRLAEVADLRMVGWDHRTSSLAVLEQVAVPRDARGALLHRLRGAGYPEAVVLSTCSRTEVYLRQRDGAVTDALDALAGFHEVRPCARPPGVVLQGGAVVRRLFEVAAGLDSRILGEVEIRDQVRTALRDAEASGAVGPALRRLFCAALRSAARVHERTDLGAQGRSLGRHAVRVGLGEVASLPEPFVLVVGSGRMARTAVESLADRGVRAHVAARDRAVAARLVGARRVVPLPALHVGLTFADLVICATSASSYVITEKHVRRGMQSRSVPLTVVDLSVPRNVDVAVTGVPGVRLIDLSRLHDHCAADPAFQEVVRTARDLVQAEQQDYLADVASRAAVPVIVEMRRQVERLCLAEMTRRAPVGRAGPEAAAVARSISGKLLHGPVMAARAAAASGDDALLGLLREMFGTPDGEGPPRQDQHT